MILSQCYDPKISVIILLRLTSKNKHPRRAGCPFVTTCKPSLKIDAWFCLEETCIISCVVYLSVNGKFCIQFWWLLVNVTWINSDAEGQRTIRSVTYTALYHFCFLWWENKHAMEFSMLGLYVTRGHFPFGRDTLVLWLPSGCLHCTPVIAKGDQIREDKVRSSERGGIRSV